VGTGEKSRIRAKDPQWQAHGGGECHVGGAEPRRGLRTSRPENLLSRREHEAGVQSAAVIITVLRARAGRESEESAEPSPLGDLCWLPERVENLGALFEVEACIR
jgi:hypothetical protein